MSAKESILHPREGRGGSLVISFGRYGGFYLRKGWAKGICLGFIAITYYPRDMDFLAWDLEEWAAVGKPLAFSAPGEKAVHWKIEVEELYHAGLTLTVVEGEHCVLTIRRPDPESVATLRQLVDIRNRAKAWAILEGERQEEAQS